MIEIKRNNGSPVKVFAETFEYEAYDREPDPGISWTINEEWFHQYAEGMGRQVKERLVNRDEVFAFVSRRHEQEIIIL